MHLMRHGLNFDALHHIYRGTPTKEVSAPAPPVRVHFTEAPSMWRTMLAMAGLTANS